ncbi:DMT family transporter [Halalkalibacillus halophilus]|uniref:DMT family transporter n=1 Tax=Halalkalibacillus halophilus TaxID=392827 RepID=UPI00042627F9|nr:DMT family transporter [Halalkalibacillus halophilus]
MVRSYIFLILTVIIFSGNLIVGKAINDLPPVTITFFRCLIAFLVVLPFGLKQVNWNRSLYLNNWKALLGLALSGITLFNILIYLALNFTTSINAGIVEAATPVFAIILGYIFLKERLTKKQLIGAAISFFGAVWVLTSGSLHVLFSLGINIGDFFMVLAILVWAIYSLLIKQHNHKFPLYGSVLIILGIGVILLIPTMMIEWMVVGGIPDALFVQSSWFGLLYLGIFPSFIALVFWTKGVNDIGPSLASVFLNFLPIFTTIGAVLFLDESVSVAQLFGGVLVIFGVLLVNVNFRQLFKWKRSNAG